MNVSSIEKNPTSHYLARKRARELAKAGQGCTMPVCYADVRTAFSTGKWAPSLDRFPIPGREGGWYVVGNYRLAHVYCNRREGSAIGGSRGKGAKKPGAGPRKVQ